MEEGEIQANEDETVLIPEQAQEPSRVVNDERTEKPEMQQPLDEQVTEGQPKQEALGETRTEEIIQGPSAESNLPA